MTFLNASLLAGAAALLIPLIIHLLNRARLQLVDWGAMHLLDLDTTVNSRRLELRALLLLLVRCCIPVALALCLARPVLTAWRSVGGRGNAAIILLIDNSLSMQAFAENATLTDTTALDLAKHEASALIAGLGSGTRYSILSIGGKPTSVSGGSSADWRSARPMLSSIHAGAGPSRIADSLTAAIQELERLPESRRSIVLYSDFQRSEWHDVSNGSLEAICNQLASHKMPSRIALFPIRTKPTENLSIEIDTTVHSIAVLGQTLDVHVKVTNHGHQPVSRVPVTLQIDAIELARKTVDVGAKATANAAFACKFDAVGSSLISAKLVDSSPVKGDDAAYIAVNVIDRIETLIIDPSSHLPQLQRESAFLQLALAPLESSSTAEADLIRVTVSSLETLTEEGLGSVRVVILVDVPEVSDEGANLLADFVDRGGTLLIFSGDSLRADWYNARWGLGAMHTLLPMKYASLSTAASRNHALSRIRQEVFSHPALSMFNNRNNGELTNISFYSWYRLEQFANTQSETANVMQRATQRIDPAHTVSSESSLIVAALDSGDPLIAEKRFGQGVVIQFASSCDSQWSDLPHRPVFLPMIQQFVTSSIFISEPDRSLDCGQKFSLQLRNRNSLPKQAAEPTVDSVIQAIVTTPTGQRFPVISIQPAEQPKIEFDWTQHPGGYALQFDKSNSQSDERKTEYFAATSAPSESNLELLTDEELTAVASQLDAGIMHSTDDVLSIDNERQFGREIWRYALLMLTVFLLGELWLQQRLARMAA